jgi:hypothetical protein
VAKFRGWVAKLWGRMPKLVARPLSAAALLVQIQTSLKNHIWETQEKKWRTHATPQKKETHKKFALFNFRINTYIWESQTKTVPNGEQI